MRLGVLTGGGDCPGLNAVIRAVVRRGVLAHGMEFLGFQDGWRGAARGRDPAARHRPDDRDPASRRDDPRVLGGEPAPRLRRSGEGARDARTPPGGRARRDRRGGHPRGGRGARRPWDEDRGRPEDHRQRPRRHGRDRRVPHGGPGRHGRDRPSALDRREPRPRDGGRGDGPPRRLDRRLLGDGRRRRRDLDPRAAVRPGRGLSPPPPSARHPDLLLDRGRRRRRDAQGRDPGAARAAAGRERLPEARRAGRPTSRRRWSGGPGSRRG